MKTKILILLLISVILCTTLTSCGEALKLFNNIWDFVVPGGGDSDTNNFWFEFKLPDFNRCTNHVIVPLEAISPTCTTPGMSGGQVCQKCGTVIVAQTELPSLDHEYSDTEDTDCNRCGYTRTIRCVHERTEIIPEIPSTCISTGRTEGIKCLDCEKIISGYEVIQLDSHTYDNNLDAYCNICDYKRKVECPHVVTEKLNAKKPTCTETGLTEGTACVHCGEVLIAQQEIAVVPHTEGDWIVSKAPTEQSKGEKHTECTVCGATIKTSEIDVIDPNGNQGASRGLSFLLNDDENSYSLVDIGSCTDTKIVIPAYYNNKPVTKIANGAFTNQTHVVSIFIPKGILNIGIGAFKGCTSLESIVIPDTVTSIKESAFYNCQALVSVTLPNDIHTIEKYTFYGCHLLKEIDVPYGVTLIDDYAFYGCVSLETVALPESLETIGKRAFYYVGLTQLVIPSSIKSISNYALQLGELDENGEYKESNLVADVYLSKGTCKLGSYVFSKKTTINFSGTAMEWNEIFINPMNYNYTVVCTDKTFTH